MTDWHKESQRTYAELADYAGIRSKELTAMLQYYIEVTDSYGELVCHIVLILGQTPPRAMSLSLLKFVGQASLVDDAMLPS